MTNFLEMFQELNKKTFSVQETPLKVFSETYRRRRYVRGGGVILSYNCNTSSASQSSPRRNCVSPGRSKVNQGIVQQNILASPILLIGLRDTKRNGGKGSHR